MPISRQVWCVLFLVSCSDKGGFTVYNTPPAAVIVEPVDGAIYEEGAAIEFYGLVDDNQQAAETLALSWSSDIDGIIGDDVASATGEARLVTARLTPGTHVITLRVLDADATSGEDWIQIVVVDLEEAPSLDVRYPSADDYGIEGEAVSFEVIVSDPQDAPEDLLVLITEPDLGEICGDYADASGRFDCAEVLPPGEYSLLISVTDTDGYQAEVELPFAVLALVDIDNDEDGYAESDGDCDDLDSSIRPDAEEVYNDVDDDCDDLVDEGTVNYDDDGDGQTELGGDCDDADKDIYTGAAEVCDGQDDDCDTLIDEGTSCVDDDGDGLSELEGDCDDTTAVTLPGATELEDGQDNDCDGIVDEGTAAYDDDGDGYTENAGDCDDAERAVSPAAAETCDDVDNNCDGTIDEDTATDAKTWYADDDNDAYGDAADTVVRCDQPSGYVSNDDDCNDSASTTSPGAAETCDSVDNDCDGSTDEGVTTTFYRDSDSDGYGNVSSTVAACSVPSGYVATGTDCNDSDAAAYPGAAEYCDGADDDCDGTVDESSAVDAKTWYGDGDGDGYGGTRLTAVSCSAPSGYVSNNTDCDDGEAGNYPGASEYCDGDDNDCDGTTDESSALDASTWYLDSDGDRYGTSSVSTAACSAPSGYVSSSSDCNDSDATAYPGAVETCDSVDDDCDGTTDEGVTSTFYRDADGDGYGTSSVSTAACSAPSGYVSNSSDCNDSDASRSPLTYWYIDSDGDGYGGSTAKQQCTQPSGYVATGSDCNDGSASAYPGATERCDSIDNDCDGSTDEVNASGCTTYYRDYDGDGYGTTTSQCACSTSGYYTATNSSDCYDTNTNARPGQTSYFTTSRGDGSYDYNCDGSQSKRYTNTYGCSASLTSCSSYTEGWSSSVPSCGSTSTYETGCFGAVYLCTNTGSTSRTQECR